jgi:hypothetical protein
MAVAADARPAFARPRPPNVRLLADLHGKMTFDLFAQQGFKECTR